MGRNHDLVGPEEAQRVLDREHRVGVADPALRIDAVLLQAVQRPGQALVRGVPRTIVVGGPVLQP